MRGKLRESGRADVVHRRVGNKYVRAYAFGKTIHVCSILTKRRVHAAFCPDFFPLSHRFPILAPPGLLPFERITPVSSSHPAPTNAEHPTDASAATGKLITMHDVAAAAGLSRTTVSKYFNGHTSLKPATRALIERVCAELHYVPDLHAVSLVKGRSQLIGVILPVIADAFYGEVLRHMQDQAAAAGFQLVVLCSHNDAATEEAAVRTLRSMKVQGLVITAVASDRNRALYAKLAGELRIVFLDSYVDADCCFVMNDNVQSVGLLVAHLLQRGAEPAYLGAPAVARPSHDERLSGYTLAMLRAGRVPRIVPIPADSLTWEFEAFARAHVGRWLEAETGQRDRCDALICATDRLALGAMAALRQIGKVPGRDMLVVGHDDVPMCEYISPALTTARQDLEAIGRATIDCLTRPDNTTRIQLRFPARLVVRESA